MDYEIKVTSEAAADLDAFLAYLVNVKQNPQAARHLLDDFENTKNTLSVAAGSFKLCDNPRLKQLGYHRLNFLTMNFFLLYRVEGQTVIIDAIFHSRQDYENKMR